MNRMEAALNYAEKYSVIPVDKNKRPLIKWQPFQEKKADKKQIMEWWTKFNNPNIAIITGKLSNIIVVDTDTIEATQKIQNTFGDGYVTPIQRTPRGGMHFFFQYEQGYLSRRICEGIDIKTDGGMVTVAPSENDAGKKWQWLDGLDLLEITPNIIPIITKDYIKEYTKSLYIRDVDKSVDTPQKLSTTVYMFQNGRRDEDLFHTANCLVKGGANKEEIYQILQILMKSWGESDDKWIYAKIDSALKRAERKERNLAEEVRDWVCLQTGYFLSTECLQCLQLSTREEKKNLSIILKRLCDQRVIERFGERSGSFRKIETEIELIDWENADDSILPLQFPFEIERFVSIMPKNILVIAGIPNAGKTAYLLNFARMNMDKWPILYFSSEMDGAELKARLKKFEGSIKQWRKIGFYRKEEDFANALSPDGVNIIDFLEITDKFYLIAERLREYHKRLNKGILFVAIQKDPQKEYGRGGGLGLEKPRLYLTMDRGRMKIVKGKTWASDRNPEGMEIDFKIVQGAKFIIQEDWKLPEKKIYKEKRFGDD